MFIFIKEKSGAFNKPLLSSKKPISEIILKKTTIWRLI